MTDDEVAELIESSPGGVAPMTAENPLGYIGDHVVKPSR
jgi:hypothetical protein